MGPGQGSAQLMSIGVEVGWLVPWSTLLFLIGVFGPLQTSAFQGPPVVYWFSWNRSDIVRTQAPSLSRVCPIILGSLGTL